MHVEDLDISPSKIGETAQRIVDRAIRGSAPARACAADQRTSVSRVRAGRMGHVRRGDARRRAESAHHSPGDRRAPAHDAVVRRPRAARLAGDQARLQAGAPSRQPRRPPDASRPPICSPPCSRRRRAFRCRSCGATASSPRCSSSRLNARMRDMELREERLKKRFELPPFLKHFATNLNLLARQDKLPPVFGRDKEIQQVLEILCHRERANSVMLIGEPGVGKTAIVEGLARRIEFEPETVPVRLRDCQVVNLQMNTMVAGTMLRGMFEDRIQNVIRELKERPNLILFVDEAHTMVGAGSALGAPSDAANVLQVGARARRDPDGRRDDAQRVQGIHPGRRGAGAPLPLRARLRADDRGDAADPLQPAAAPRAQLLGPPARRGDRNRARHVAALHAAPAPARQGDRLARHGRGARRDRSPLGSERRRTSSRSSRTRRRFRRTWSSATSPIASRTSRSGCSSASSVRRTPSSAVARRLVLNKGPLKDGFDRPDGVLLFLGPTGVGKTELAKAVAEFLFGDEKKMIRVDMSEYQDGSVAVDKLIGMPRGIVGSERGGILTNQLKDNPVHRRAARRGREGEPEPAEPVPAGVRRRLADRRPRQARLSERRRRHHDVEHRLGELPQAHEPAGLPVADGRRRAGRRAR